MLQQGKSQSRCRRALRSSGALAADRCRGRLLALSLSAALAATSAVAAEVTLLDKFNLALAVKRQCSVVYVSHREWDEGWRNSSSTFLSPKAQQAKKAGSLSLRHDEAKRMVVGTWDGVTAKARFFGAQGCVILPDGSADVLFTPVAVVSGLPPAADLPWPMGDREPEAPAGLAIDRAKVKQALAVAFSNPDDHTAAFLAVHQGQIIAERYGPDVDKETQLESWSMGKSVTATLVGLLIEQGHFGLWDAAPVPEWQVAPRDPRAAIRVADLLRMSSGLFFTHSSDPVGRLARSYIPGQPDHSLGYTSAVDVFQLSESRPLEHPPNTVGRYRNCDPLVLGSIVKRTVESQGQAYLAWPQSALFDKIGVRRQVLETDVYGNFVLTGFDFGTGRNWARLGMLYLQDGLWTGERLLPEGFAEFVSTPAPAWRPGVYGGQFWVGHPALPDGAYSMRGAGGQEVSIVPSHDLVLVRLGHTRGAAGDYAARRNRAYGLIVQAIDPEWRMPSEE